MGENLAGRLWAASGLSPSSSDGFTYLNDPCRELLKDAASALTAVEDAVRQLDQEGHGWPAEIVRAALSTERKD